MILEEPRARGWRRRTEWDGERSSPPSRAAWGCDNWVVVHLLNFASQYEGHFLSPLFVSPCAEGKMSDMFSVSVFGVVFILFLGCFQVVLEVFHFAATSPFC